MANPFKDWVPGVLCESQLRQLREEGYILESPERVAADPSSLDLHLDDLGFKLKNGSVKPFGMKYLHGLRRKSLVEDLKPESDGAYTLEKGSSYLFRLKEKLHVGEESMYGQATAKSSIGRVDVLARLIVDGMNCYEGFDPVGATSGTTEMFVEITPMSFSVKVKPGIPITQIRVFYGRPETSEVSGSELYRTLLRRVDRSEVQEGYLCVDATNTEVPGWPERSGAAFAVKQTKPDGPIPLWETEPNSRPLATDFWELKQSSDDRFIIETDKFYIMRSKELISLPSEIAVYCRANDETIGEMRIHYAGFVHPYFGHGRDDGALGTPLIFELRGHSVTVNLGDAERLCKLFFYRMSKGAAQPQKQAYDKQIMKLSKFFADPAEVEIK